MLDLMRQIRAAIQTGTFATFRAEFLARYQMTNQTVRHEQRERFLARTRPQS
jgi:queuine/archaeosine tRNA-ribosyltransferase